MKTSLSRRHLLGASLSAPLLWLACALRPGRAAAGQAVDQLFNDATSQQALDGLDAAKAEPGIKILLDVPEIADNTDRVTVRVLSTLVPTEQITILVDRALRPVVAQFNLTPDIEPDVSTTIKLPGNSVIRAVVKSAGKTYTVEHQIKLADAPCDAALPTGAAPKKRTAHGKEKRA